MKQHGGIWLPDGEEHLCQWMDQARRVVNGKLTYQYHKLEAALQSVRDWRTAVDVGAHVGLWSMHLVGRFATVYAIEPVADFRECLAKNVPPPGCNVLSIALGARPGGVTLKIDPASTGGTYICGEGTIPMKTLDMLELAEVDFLKIDCEGYELEVLKGGEATILRDRPTICVEQKPHKLGPNFGIAGQPALDWLRDRGYLLRRAISGDYIMSCDR
jgi:FkbM family methyltransferase